MVQSNGTYCSRVGIYPRRHHPSRLGLFDLGGEKVPGIVMGIEADLFITTAVESRCLGFKVQIDHIIEATEVWTERRNHEIH